MPIGNLGGWTSFILIVIILLLFAAPKLPALAKNLGQSMRIFKGEMKQMKDDDASREQAAGPVPPTAAPGAPAADAPTDAPQPPAAEPRTDDERPDAGGHHLR